MQEVEKRQPLSPLRPPQHHPHHAPPPLPTTAAPVVAAHSPGYNPNSSRLALTPASLLRKKNLGRVNFQMAKLRQRS